MKQYFKQFLIADETHYTTQILFQLVGDNDISGKKIHDANIVASMIENNIKKILTHNVQDFKRFTNKIEIIPLF